MKGKKNKVVVIGVDGATFDIMLPMMERGELPAFKAVMEGGSWARLRSTYPPHTVPAWVSMASGMNPGKLGLYDFTADMHGSYDEGRVCISTDAKGRPVWDILSERGSRVIVVAVPMTYPPSPVNGIIVAPKNPVEPLKVKTFPPEIGDELHREIDLGSALRKRREYMGMHMGHVNADTERFFSSTYASSRMVNEKLSEGAAYLLSRYDFDFAFVMLTVDSIQHYFWCFMDPGHPSYKKELAGKYGNAVYDAYRWADEGLSRIMKALGDDVTFVLVSDHGFGPLHRFFFTNRWLMERGLLKLKGGKRNTLTMTRMQVGSLFKRIGMGSMTGVFPEKIRNFRVPVLKRRKKSIAELIDWENTKAYATSYAINVNLKGREPHGVVEPGPGYESMVTHLKEELHRLRDPETGEEVIDRVLEKKEFFSGPYVDLAPDVLMFFKDPKCSARKELLHPGVFRGLTPEDRLTGHHTSFPEGICVMKGPHVAQGARFNTANIVDIVPTVLYLMGEPIPEEMDGRVLTEAVRKEYLEGNAIVRSHEAGSGPAPSAERLSPDEEDEIKKRLGDLGYMG